MDVARIIEKAAADLAVAAHLDEPAKAAHLIRPVIETLIALISEPPAHATTCLMDHDYCRSWKPIIAVPNKPITSKLKSKQSTIPIANYRLKPAGHCRPGFCTSNEPGSVGHCRPGTCRLAHNSLTTPNNQPLIPGKLVSCSVDYCRSGTTSQATNRPPTYLISPAAPHKKLASRSVDYSRSGTCPQATPKLSAKLTNTVPLPPKPHDYNLNTQRNASRSKTKPAEHRVVTNRFGIKESTLNLATRTTSSPKMPIKLLIRATGKIGSKTTYSSSLLENSPAPLPTSNLESRLLKDLDRSSRSEYYKSLNINNNNFDRLDELPSFNTGRKPIDPSDLSRLKKMVTVKIETPPEYLKLHETIAKSEQLMDGRLNVEKICCNPKGKSTIICEDEGQKKLLMELLAESAFSANDAKIKNITFAIFGIPKIRKSEEIVSELTRRDKRFKKDTFKIKERFPISTVKDAITLSCCESLTSEIIKKRHVFLGTKKYTLSKFVDLVQCFKCSRFGHTSANCNSKKMCCPNCAYAHSLNECTIEYTPKCGNCSCVAVGHTDHSSWDARCPYRLMWIKKQKACLRT